MILRILKINKKLFIREVFILVKEIIILIIIHGRLIKKIIILEIRVLLLL